MSRGRVRSARLAILALACSALPAAAAQLLDQGFATTVLPTPVSLAASRDERHLYVVDASADTISIFAHNPTGPFLSLLDTEAAPIQAPSLRSVVVSPDDRTVFVSSDADAVIAYERDSATGALTLINVVVDGGGDVIGLVDPVGMAVSPGGEFLYVAADGALVVLTIAQDGALLFSEAQQNGVEGVTGLGEGRAVALSRDGRHIYVAAAGPPGQLVFFRRDFGEALLEFVGANYYTPLDPTPLVDVFDVIVSRDGRYLYLGVDVDAGVDGARIGFFARDTSTGTPTFLEEEGTNGVFPLGLIERLDGRAVFAADSERIVTLPVDPETGSLVLTPPVTFGSPGVPVNGVPKVALLGDTLYVADVGNDRIQRFGVAPLLVGDVKLDSQLGGNPDTGLDGAASVVASQDGRYVYVTGSVEDAVSVFATSTPTALTFVETERDGVNGVEGIDGADGIALSPDGKHLYVTGFFDASIAVFSRDATGGGITFASVVTESVGGVDGLTGIDKVVVSPDGRHVYATGGIDDAVAAFTRNTTTGALAFVEREKNGESGVTDLDNPQGLAISPDGKHLYVAAFTSGAVVNFTRNAATGALTFGSVMDSIPVDLDLESLEGIAVSPDGTGVFVASSGLDWLVSFDRNADTGALNYEGRVSGASSPGLDGVNAVATSLDGRYVIAAARDSEAVTVFHRNAGNALTQVQSEPGSNFGGFGGARGVGVGPGSVFVTGGTDDALVRLVPEPAASLLGAMALNVLVALGRRKKAFARPSTRL